MSETAWNLEIATERLILRPQQPRDYEAWYTGFASRLHSQHKYDKGQVDLSECDFQFSVVFQLMSASSKTGIAG